jgi:hypothetical protein
MAEEIKDKSKRTVWIVVAVMAIIGIASVFTLQKTGRFTSPILTQIVGPTCGNNVCESGENSNNCCKDCGCPPYQKCFDNVCKTYCGNGICDSDENCDTCPQDCKCPRLDISLRAERKVTWEIWKGCQVEVFYSVKNNGNAVATNTNLYLQAKNIATGALRDSKTIYLGAINEGEYRSGSTLLDIACGDDRIQVDARVTNAEGRTVTQTTYI